MTSVNTDFPPTTEEIIETFEEMPHWDERYEYLVELGRELPELNEHDIVDDNLVDGCMSKVWLVTKLADESAGNGAAVAYQPGEMVIEADSDSLIVKGLIVVLLAFYRGKTPAEVIQADEKSYLSQLELDQHLSPGRRNGLFSMVKRIKQLGTELAAGTM